MLTRLWARDVEPFDRPLELDLGSRLNLLCGDNGLGKTFVLDLAWYVLTGTWAHRAVLPQRGQRVNPAVGGSFERAGEKATERTSYFAAARQEWGPLNELASPLTVYAKSNGDFELWDRYRTSGAQKYPLGLKPSTSGGRLSLRSEGASSRFAFSAADVWDGLSSDDGVVLCNGLLRDWVSWQYQRPELFELFSNVLAALSPRPKEILRPGPARRVSLEDVREIPTLKLPYADVPVTHASSAMRRVLSLAYVLVWAWREHLEAAKFRNQPPVGDLILLIDEVDAHLHPQWQRVVLPAIFKAVSAIERSLHVQLMASTHSPLVLASVEPLFDESTDKLLHFELDEGGKIKVEELPWVKQGDATNWLVSESFGLEQARSREAEVVIESAEAFMRGEPVPPFDTREKIEAELRRVLPDHDDFWPRWVVETGPVR